MKRMIILLLVILFLCCGCSEKSAGETEILPTDAAEESTQASGYTDLFAEGDAVYYNTEEGIYTVHPGEEAQCVDAEGFLLGFHDGAAYLQKGNTVFVGFGEAQKKLFEVATETGWEADMEGFDIGGKTAVFYGNFCQRVIVDEEQGHYSYVPGDAFSVILNLAEGTYEQNKLEHGLDGLAFENGQVYYAQNGGLYRAGEEPQKLCDTSLNIQQIVCFGEDLLVYDETTVAFVYRAATQKVESLPFKQPGDIAVCDGKVYGSHKDGGGWVYDVATAKEQDAEGFFTSCGILQETYDHAAGRRVLKATVGGEEHTAYIEGKNTPEIVNAVFDETGVVIRTRDGKVSPALWR